MGIGVTELLLILAIVLLMFGTKKLRNIGSDLGGAIRNFRTAMREGEEEKKNETPGLERRQQEGERPVIREKERA